MYTKKYLKSVLFTFICLFMLPLSSALAENDVGINKSETKISVSIGELKEKEIKPGVYKPKVDPSINKLLPKTNEVINVLLVLLGLICTFVLLIGLIMFKKTYDENNYAFV